MLTLTTVALSRFVPASCGCMYSESIFIPEAQFSSMRSGSAGGRAPDDRLLHTCESISRIVVLIIRIIPVVRRGGCRSHLFNRHAVLRGSISRVEGTASGWMPALMRQLGDLTRQVHIRRPRVVHLAEHARSGEEQRIERRALPELALGRDGTGFWL